MDGSGTPAARDDGSSETTRSETPVVDALKRGEVEVALALIESGGDVNARDDRLDSAFLFAGANGLTDVVRAALRHGADVTVTNRFGGVALIPACERGHVETVQVLLQTDIDVNHVNRLGWTALHEAIVLSDGGPRQVQIVRMLLDAGADPEFPDKDGVAPLTLARRLGHTDIADLLQAAVASTSGSS